VSRIARSSSTTRIGFTYPSVCADRPDASSQPAGRFNTVTARPRHRAVTRCDMETKRSRPLNLKVNRRGPRHPKKLLGDDELSRELGEGYVRSVTSAEHSADDIRDEEVPEEHGGPFVATDASDEFADDVDGSNPLDA